MLDARSFRASRDRRQLSASVFRGTQLLNHWGINAVIALNPKNNLDNNNDNRKKYPPSLRINDNGVPFCPGGRPMVYHGFCNDRCRLKWRCPRIAAALKPCDACASCSPSSYGRVIYTKPDWDPRLFTKIPRGSDTWKDKMKQRTAAERVNDRILIDYGVENTRARGKKRISFHSLLAAVNIHLDA